MKNYNYYHIQEAIGKITEDLKNSDCSFSVFGSGVYGNKLGLNVKPNDESDIDTNLVIKDYIPLDELSKYLGPVSKEGIEKFKDKSIDVLALRGNYEGRPILFQCMNEDVYLKSCIPDNEQIIMHKKSRVDKIPKPKYPYDIFNLDGGSKNIGYVSALKEGNRIVYDNRNFPFENGIYHLTVQQRQILTQEEFVDKDNFLKKGRLKIMKNLRDKLPRKNYINFFQDQFPFWSNEFKEKMEKRLK